MPKKRSAGPPPKKPEPTLLVKLTTRREMIGEQRKATKERHDQASAVADQTKQQLQIISGALAELDLLIQEIGPAKPEAAPDLKVVEKEEDAPETE